MNIYFDYLCYTLFSKISSFIQVLLSNSLFLLLSLLILAITFLFISLRSHKHNKTYRANLFTALFIAFVQIIVTVFIIEKIIERYQENQWEKTKILIDEIVNVELQDDLTSIVYTMDFSAYGKPHAYIEMRLDWNQKLSKEETIYAARSLVDSLKLNDFADHYRYKKGDDIIGFQARIVEQFASQMEINLRDLDRIIDFSQIKLSSSFYYKLIQCRKEYHNLFKNAKDYSRFLSASEITGELIEYNLKFETKYKKQLYNSLLNTISILIDILTTEKFD